MWLSVANNVEGLSASIKKKIQFLHWLALTGIGNTHVHVNNFFYVGVVRVCTLLYELFTETVMAHLS